MHSVSLPSDENLHRNVVKQASGNDPDEDVYIGRSEVAMWIRVVSSWVCMVLYIWSLIAPVLMPDRYVLSIISLVMWIQFNSLQIRRFVTLAFAFRIGLSYLFLNGFITYLP